MSEMTELTGRRVMTLAAATFTAIAFGQESALASGDAEKGAAVFVRQCALCHTIDRGGANRFGPNLFGIVVRKAAMAPGYKYSPAFKSTANWTWSADVVASFIAAPGMMISGSRMAVFQGVADKDLDDIVAYLSTQK